MTPFTIDHPLAAKTSWLDSRAHPKLSFLCSTLLLALMLAPFILVRLYDYAVSDIGAEPNPFPDPWWALFWGGIISFLIGICVAAPMVWLGRRLTRRSGRRFAS